MFSQINPRALIALCGLVNIVSGSPYAFEKKESTVFDCLDAGSVPTVLSSNANYSEAIAPFNLRLPWQPAVFTVPETAEDVSGALRCAKQFGYKVAARSGGHSYAAFGLGGQNGSFIVDVHKLNTTSVDQTTGKAKIGAGTKVGNMALSLYAQGQRALPHGLCPGIGLSGHALHGGFGFTSRMWGTTLDKILEIEVVLTNGTITTASEDVNSDLFWALRGAGDSYGVVTGFTMQTEAAPASGLQYTYTWDNSSVPSVADRIAIFSAFQEYANTTAPAELALRAYMMADVFEVTGAYWGARADFETVMEPLLAKWPSGYNVTINEAAWLDLLYAFGDEVLKQPEDYDLHNTFFAKSVVSTVQLTNSTLTSLFNYLDNGNSTVVWFVDVDVYGGINSKISSISADSSSYSIRDSFLTLQLYASSEDALPPFPASGIEFMNGMADSIKSAQPETKFKAYANYVDSTLSASEAHELYYGDNYERLLSIKKSVDPDSVMWNPQTVGA